MIEPTDPDRAFALGHVPGAQRAAVAALWALDEQLGQIVASTTQPMVGQMRLLWWREVLISGVSGHPLLAELTSVRACGIDTEALGTIVEGWEELLEPLPLSEAQLAAYAAQRGTQLFALTAQICDVTCPAEAGAGWALADFGFRCSDPVTSSRALGLAREILATAEPRRLSRPLRILVRLAQGDVTAGKKTVRSRWKLLRSVA
ncbi:squalene/phytoene synthase family protein [Sphingomonas sp. SUN039]|uniref:squalene/phytoene synthase family protein n=1 Tax=Sphingomonas sp. SUN039 TaxID=2937787 RepID=UPI00216427E9|nr:squalene/phytoene synthase family protein [Sphingomonas sp. SUN039]UVO53222.1 squalene/phytoene synthase family protein [Sphingomonas sp. SUN039]